MAEKYTPIFDENVARKLVVAKNEGNDLANTEFASDMRSAPYAVLEHKYGKDIADQSKLYTEQRLAVDRIEDADRNAAQIVGDTAASVASGFAGTVGSIGALGLGVAGKVDEYFDPENTGLSDAATKLSNTTSKLTNALKGFQSQELQDRRELSGIEAQLDAEDNLAQFERDTEGRDANFIDNLAMFGRGTLNNAGRILSDTSLTADVVAEGIGSLGPSAKMASVASKLVTSTKSFQAAKAAHLAAPTQATTMISRGADLVERAAIAATVGVAEGAGVYTDTVNNILGRKHGELMEGSEEYARLVESGVDPDDAKAQIAANAGMEAFGRQFPTAIALGMLSARFEAAPLSTFRGSDFIGGLRTVGVQALEEGGQGATGQVNTNMAIRDNVDADQTLMEGVDEQFAVGAIAGAGMAGTLAAPAVVAATPRVIAKGVVDTVKSDAASKLAAATGSVASAGAKGVVQGTKAAADSRVGQAINSGTKKATAAAGNKVEDYVNRPDKKLQTEDMETAASIAQLAEAELNTPIPADADKPLIEVSKKQKAAVEAIVRQPTETDVPSTFSANVKKGGTVLDNIAGIMATFSEKGFRINRMSDSDAIYAAEQFKALQSGTKDLPKAIRNQVKKVLVSNDFAKVNKRVAAIDLNATTDANTEITDDVVSQVKTVAKTNPINSNPDLIDKVLLQNDRKDVSAEDVRILKEAKKISLAMNSRIGNEVEFVKKANIQLQEIGKQRGQKPNLVALKDFVTRDIAVGNDVRSIPGMRSVKQFVSDIFVGSQSADGNYVDGEGYATDVKIIGKDFNNFAQHMINKVGAFNTSFDNRNANNRGSDETFTALVPGKGLVEGAGKSIVYQAGSPRGILLAKQIHADAVMTVEAYNAAVRAFPESFPEGELSVPELRGFETLAPASKTEAAATTIVEEEGAPAASDEAPDAVDTVISDVKKRLKGKKTKIVLKTLDTAMASYAPKAGTVSLDLEKIKADYDNDMSYLDGNGETTSEQKAVVFENVDLEDFKAFMKDKGLETYVKFIIEHELQHARQISRGEVYPKDLMDPKAIAMERDANDAGFKAVGYVSKVEAKPEVEATSISKMTFDNVSPKFKDTYIPKDKDVSYANGQEILDMVAEQEGTEGFIEFVGVYFNELMETANKRLKNMTLTGKVAQKGDTSISEAIMVGEDTTKYRPYMATMMADQTTGEYDPALLSIAAVAVLDWLSSARSGNPKAVKDQLADMQLSFSDVTSEQIQMMMYGVPVRDTVDNITKSVLRMWNMDPNFNAPRVEETGAVEGLVKELLRSMVVMKTGMFDEVSIDYFDKAGRNTALDNLSREEKTAYYEGTEEYQNDFDKGFKYKQTMFDVRPMLDLKDDIGLLGQGAATKLLTPEFDPMPSIGRKPKSVDQTQGRSDIPLSDMEKAALTAIQETPHDLADKFSAMVSAIGLKYLSPFLGEKDVSNLSVGHPLRLSREGKNLSIERDFREAMSVVDAVRDTQADSNMGAAILQKPETKISVFFRAGITSVGRHQMKNINPQNNKILRSLVTAATATLDMTKVADKNAFWLTVSQASGINKVDSEFHKDILSGIQNAFTLKFGDAVALAENHLNTGEMDGEAFIKAMGGTGDMSRIAAVFAVAELNLAKAAGTQNSFTTTLSFELDGKTDGPGNMMANFGQGILTEQDFENFKRVGFFLGSKDMTLNKYYGDKKNIDLYNTTSKQSQAKLYNEIAQESPESKDRLWAMTRFATFFGDLTYNEETGLHEMTRDTSKSPMTKTVYGSSERGVGQGLSDDMILNMYEKLTQVPAGKKPSEHFGYPDFEADYKQLFQETFPEKLDWNKNFLPKKKAEQFTKLTTETLGRILSQTAKSVIGDEITKVNDTLVLITAFQTEFMQAKFDELLEAKYEELAKDGKIPLTKAGKPDRSRMSRNQYNEVITELKAFSPRYSSEFQTLDIGGFEQRDSGITLSSTIDGKYAQSAAMLRPALAGVKVIPFLTQGRGDAMMINRVFGGVAAPKKALPVFDGIDMPIDKILEYAKVINEAVADNWDADILGDVVADFDRFLGQLKSDSDKKMAKEAWNRAKAQAKKKQNTADIGNWGDLKDTLGEIHRRNQARKTVFKKIGISVDHMGGSDTAFVRGSDRVYTMGEINNMISEELGEETQADPVSDVFDDAIEGEFTDITPQEGQLQITREPVAGEYSTLTVTTAGSAIDGLLRETRNKDISGAVRILKKANLNTRIVMGSAEEVSTWYKENIGEMKNGLKQDKKGLYDPKNDVILIISNTHETLVHEMIHAATFKIIEDQYLSDLMGLDGDPIISDAITRLEKLSEEFMDMDFSNTSKEVQEAANAAKAQILELQGKTDEFSKAAALNEFMAWSLSNESLMKELGEKPTSLMARMTKMIKAFMIRLLGGVKSDMLSNIQFNTELIVDPESVADLYSEAMKPDDTNADGELTPVAHEMTNFWIDLLRERISGLEQNNGSRTKGQDQMEFYLKNARSAVDALDQGGFSLSAYQKETFKAIHSVLAMEMRLSTQPAIALNSLFEFITDKLKPEMFGPNNAQDRYATVMNLFGETKNDEGVSDAIAVLLALSQTSDGFRRALDQLPTPPEREGVDTESLNSFLGSIAGMMMNKAVSSIDTADGSVRETLDKLSQSILVEDSEKEFRILAGMMKNVTKADEYLKGGFKKLANITEQKNNEIQASDRATGTKLFSGILTSMSGFLDADRSKLQADAAKRFVHMGRNLEFAVPFREMITEIVGADANNAKLMALLDRTNNEVSNLRQDYREDLPVFLQNMFETHPNEEEWKAGHNILGKTDFSAIFSLANADSSFRLISDEAFLDKKIAQAEADIKAGFKSQVAKNIIFKGKQLADFQNGKGAGYQLWTNSYAINMMAGDYKPAMTTKIDKLISMYALKGSDPKQRIMITEMYKRDPEAMKNLMTYTQGLNREEELKVVSDMARMNGYKGYLPDIGQKGRKTVIADDSRRDELEKHGYVRVADAVADEDFSLVSRGYYTTSTKQTGTYSQGIMQTVQDTYRGVDATTGLTINGTTSGVISGNAVDTITDELNIAQSVSDPKEVLIPRFDTTGVVYYERAINPDIIETYQAPKSNLALMLGSWAGRQVEEKFAQAYNKELITELKRVYDERGGSDDGLYVNLPEEAQAMEDYDNASKFQQKRMRKPDRIFVESWKVISPQTKKYIEDVFGPDQFYVRKDQMNLALGYRDPSIIDMWTGDTRIPQSVQDGVQALTALFMGKEAMKNLAAVEGGVQGVVSTAKDLIVVRSLIVPYMNTQANMFQLLNRNIGVKEMLSSYPKILSEIEQFNENKKKLIDLSTRIELAALDKNRVAVLQQQVQVILDQNKRFSIAPLLEAGAYKNISEGITDLDVEITSGRIGDWVENQTNKLPGGVKTIVKYGLLSKDTALYRGANKAVQYGDFIAKAIYYSHLVKEQKLSHDAAMTKVNEEFVNFSYLPGRTRTYMETIGATWFLTFKIRIMKIALNQIRENPVRSLIVGSTFGEFGSPIADNLATVIADDRIGYSLGWEQLFSSAGLNPWLNISDWN